MKSVFVTLHGTLVEGHQGRCVLRSGAAAGLRLLAELDYRLIVLDNGSPTPPADFPTAGPPRGGGAYASRHQPAAVPDPRWPSPPGQSQQQWNWQQPRRRRTDHAASLDRRARSDLPLRDRVTDLLFREQLPLQEFYGCAHCHDRAHAASRFACAMRSAAADAERQRQDALARRLSTLNRLSTPPGTDQPPYRDSTALECKPDWGRNAAAPGPSDPQALHFFPGDMPQQKNQQPQRAADCGPRSTADHTVERKFAGASNREARPLDRAPHHDCEHDVRHRHDQNSDQDSDRQAKHPGRPEPQHATRSGTGRASVHDPDSPRGIHSNGAQTTPGSASDPPHRSAQSSAAAGPAWPGQGARMFTACPAGGGVIARHARAGERPRDCSCLPPQPLLLLRAALDLDIDLPASWLLGATLDAVEAGNRAGCRTVLIDNGTEQVWRLGHGRVPTRIAPDLHAAALLIIEEGQHMRLY